MTASNLLATAGTLESIREAITDFYCGSSKTLIPDGVDRWRVVGTYDTDATPSLGVIVVKRRGRYRFEMVV